MLSAGTSPMHEMHPYSWLGLPVWGFFDGHNAFKRKVFIEFTPGRITQKNVY